MVKETPSNSPSMGRTLTTRRTHYTLHTNIIYLTTNGHESTRTFRSLALAKSRKGKAIASRFALASLRMKALGFADTREFTMRDFVKIREDSWSKKRNSWKRITAM